MPAADIAGVIGIVHGSLLQLVQPVPQEETRKPAVPIRRSVTAEYIVCLEDGKKLKMLKRHLRTTYGMTPDAVPGQVEPAARLPDGRAGYAEKRSELAKASGLGRRRPEPEPQPVPATKNAAVPRQPPDHSRPGSLHRS